MRPPVLSIRTIFSESTFGLPKKPLISSMTARVFPPVMLLRNSLIGSLVRIDLNVAFRNDTTLPRLRRIPDNAAGAALPSATRAAKIRRFCITSSAGGGEIVNILF